MLLPIDHFKTIKMSLTLNMTLKKSELLDMVLHAFGDKEHLEKDKVLMIFEGNENIAADYIDILSKLGHIHKMGEIEGSRLGLVFHKRKGVDLFLSEGGFTELFKKKANEHKAQGEYKALETENLKLQNEALTHQKTIREQESRIRDLDERVKHFEMLKSYEWLIRSLLVIIPPLLIWLLSK